MESEGNAGLWLVRARLELELRCSELNATSSCPNNIKRYMSAVGLFCFLDILSYFQFVVDEQRQLEVAVSLTLIKKI